MKILKSGKKAPYLITKECECGCEFEFENTECYWHKFLGSYYINCPECDDEIWCPE